MFANPDIQQLPLSSPRYMERLERFLSRNGLRYEEMDKYFAAFDDEGELLAGAGIKNDVIKCVAVSEACRSEGFTVPIISMLLSDAASRGITALKVFTKPEYETVFGSLGFRCLARAPKAILMENGRGLEEYCAYLRGLQHRHAWQQEARHARQRPGIQCPGCTGVVVMNANPFTLGHRYLLQQAARGVDMLFVIPVKEDVSRFPYDERLEMIRAAVDTPGQAEGDALTGGEGVVNLGSDQAPRIVVPDGSDYQISAATFPTYFLKDLSDASETQMLLDIDLFCRHIAPALGASVRFAGTEPSDPLTARYNELMREMLPKYGLEFRELERLCDASGPVSASRVRAALDAGRYAAASALTPESSHPYILAELADRALRMELETPFKPGLVGPDSNGAHSDMDSAIMRRGIDALRPFWPRMVKSQDTSVLQLLGIEAEASMLAATGGVNTHRGAIFCLGLALNAAGRLSARDLQISDIEVLIRSRMRKIGHTLFDNRQIDRELQITHGRDAVVRYNVKGALEMACEGYRPLFEDWLPYYRSMDGDEWRLQKTLLRIMSTLDDTCVIHRVGPERALEVKREAAVLLAEIPGQAGNDAPVSEGIPGQAGNDAPVSEGIPGQAGNDVVVMADPIGHLKEMCTRYAAEGISPGGAADMLALTIFIDSILN